MSYEATHFVNGSHGIKEQKSAFGSICQLHVYTDETRGSVVTQEIVYGEMGMHPFYKGCKRIGRKKSERGGETLP